jgi:acylphosphatase
MPEDGDAMGKQARITVRGIVQGVAFRAYTRAEAEKLGLRGYVRNCPDGSVEIVAEGADRPLEELIAWARRGPPAAVVQAADVSYLEATNAFSDFKIFH